MKSPPHNVDAERALLGAVLRDPFVLRDVQSLVGPDSFYLDPHRAVWGAILALDLARQPIELVGVHAKLRTSSSFGSPAEAGQFLAAIWDAVATGAAAVYHAGLVRDAHAMRQLIHAANEILQDANEPVGSASETVAAAERKLYALATSLTGSSSPVRSAAELVRGVCDEIDARVTSGATLAGLTTGYEDLDDKLGGLRPGELVVIGARPSLGKTALALNILSRISGGGQASLLFSLEMPARDIGFRLVAMSAGVEFRLLNRPRMMTSSQMESVARQSSPSGVSGCPIYVHDASDATAASLATVARQEVRRNATAVIAVDYLQLMRPENPKDNRATQVGTLALRMKQLARELDIPLILLSQLNRESESAGRRPQLSDLRESGDIEAHADRVLMLYRDPKLNDAEPVWPIEVLVRKNRNGPVGDVTLAYSRATMRFENFVSGG